MPKGYNANSEVARLLLLTLLLQDIFPWLVCVVVVVVKAAGGAGGNQSTS